MGFGWGGFDRGADRLWLLAAHQTYRSAFCGLGSMTQPRLLHTPFAQPDLAVEQLLVTGSNDVQRRDG